MSLRAYGRKNDHASVAQASGTFTIGGDLTVNRLGFGAMRLTGKGVWGPPADRDECIRVLRRAVELGVNFIDTADSYGPYVSERLIREALHPYPDGLVIATKAGLLRTGPDEWPVLGFPAYLRQECEMSLRRLGVDTHRPVPAAPHRRQVPRRGPDRRARRAAAGGQDPPHRPVRGQRRPARGRAEDRDRSCRCRTCTTSPSAPPSRCSTRAKPQGIGFIPWFPLAAGPLAAPGGPLQRIAADHHATPSQLALAWLLKRSPVMLPIPGTSKVAHLEENVAAAEIELSDEEFETLSKAGSAPA